MYGTVEATLTFTKAEVVAQMEVNGTYFAPHRHCDAVLYTNADLVPGIEPVITYDDPAHPTCDPAWAAKEFQPRRCWLDLFTVLNRARHLIYIAGWSVDVETVLVRQEGLEGYGQKLGDLLKKKAEMGVRVLVLQWDDMSSPNLAGALPTPGFLAGAFPTPGGVMATKDEQTRTFFRNTGVTAAIVPRLGDPSEQPYLFSSATRNAFYLQFSHHQKVVIADAAQGQAPFEGAAPPPGWAGDDARELVAFVGGLDLTKGRFDLQLYPLFSTLGTLHKDDFRNKSVKRMDPGLGPRQPWRDIHSCVRGPVVYDLLANFEERWRRQVADKQQLLVALQDRGLSRQDVERRGVWRTDANAWTIQVGGEQHARGQ